MTRKNILEENKAVLFTNWTKELFAHPSLGGGDEHCQWDGVPYSFKPKSKTYLPDYLAAHFAKHLVNRELNNMENENAHSDAELRQQMIDRCYADNLGEVVADKAKEKLEKKIAKLDDMKKDDLIKFAKKEKIDVSRGDTKADIMGKVKDKLEGNLDEDEFEGNQ